MTKANSANRFSSLALFVAMGWGAVGGVSAQSGAPAEALLVQRFVISGGAFLVQSDLTARLNGQSANNPEIDFDETFGKADSSTRVRLDGLWRITPTHHVSLMYFNTRDTRSKTLANDVTWGDNTYQVGADVSSEREFKVGALAYEYAFMHKPTYEVAAIVGLHVSDLTLTLAGNARVTDSNGNVSNVQKVSQTNSVMAPLPVIGLRGAWVVMPNLLLETSGQFFKIKAGEVDGYWTDLRASGTWMFTKNFGLGLGYDRYFNKVNVEGAHFDGRVKYGYSGLRAFATASF